jgi:nitrate/nitrite transporter NarK
VALGAGTAFLRSSAGDFFVGATERIPYSLRSSGMGFLAACGGIGGFFGPTLFGWVRGHTGGFAAGLVILAGILFIGALLGLCVARDFPRRTAPSRRSTKNR